jgi:hypothetical protein
VCSETVRHTLIAVRRSLIDSICCAGQLIRLKTPCCSSFLILRSAVALAVHSWLPAPPRHQRHVRQAWARRALTTVRFKTSSTHVNGRLVDVQDEGADVGDAVAHAGAAAMLAFARLRGGYFARIQSRPMSRRRREARGRSMGCKTGDRVLIVHDGSLRATTICELPVPQFLPSLVSTCNNQKYICDAALIFLHDVIHACASFSAR